MAKQEELSLWLRLKDGVSKSLKEIEKTFAKSFDALKTSSLIFAGAFAGVIAGIFSASKAFEESQAVAAQTEKVLLSTGMVAGMTAKAVNELAVALQNKTGIDDDVIQSGENILLTFTNIGKESFPTATKAALDMTAALNNGIVTQENLKGTMIQLGKALNDPTQGMTVLRRVGVSFTESQQEQIKTLQASGNLLAAQTLILKELEKEFGGSSEKLNTLQGAYTMARTQAGNFMELLGEQLAPAMTKIAEIISKTAIAMGDFIKSHKDLILPVTAAIAVFTGLIAALGGIIAIAPMIAAAWVVITGPIGITVAAIAGLTAATVYFSTSQTKLAENVRAVWTGLQGIYTGNIDKIKKAWADLSESSKTHNEKMAESTKQRAEKEAAIMQKSVDDAKAAAMQKVKDETETAILAAEEAAARKEEQLALEEEEKAIALEKKAEEAEAELAADADFMALKADMEAVNEEARIAFEEQKKQYDSMSAAQKVKLLTDTLGKEKIARTLAQIDELTSKGKAEEAKRQMDLLASEAFLKLNEDTLNKLENGWKYHWTFLLTGEKLSAKQRADIDQAMGQFYQDILLIMGEKSLEAFRFMQAISIAQTLMQTYEAAQKAFTSLASVPYVGLALGIAAAGVATAAGLMRVEQIRSQRPPAMEVGGQVVKGGLAELHPAEVVLNEGQAKEYKSGGQEQTINLIMDGETMQKWIIKQDEETKRMEKMGIR
jgi:hypothetical protein